MRKIQILFMSTLLFLAGCTNVLEDDEEIVQNEEDSPVETAIVPGNQLQEDTYRMILPYQTSEARGVIVRQLANRIDIDEMEEGLRRHSVDVYSPDDYFFQEGSYLSQSDVENMIEELNPGTRSEREEWDQEQHENNPRIFSHILEQNYLTSNEDNTVQVEGISIGIALKSVYSYQLGGGGDNLTYDISTNEMLEKGYEVADYVVKHLREMEDVPDVPIMIALYQEESQTSPIPGNYVMRTVVNSGSDSIDSWNDIDEEYVLFPSSQANDNYLADAENFNSFGNEIAKFFPNYVGAIGSGFYVGGELQQLTIEVPIEFQGKAEVIGFSQYTYGLVQDIFPSYYDLEINITSSDKQESLIYRKAQEEEPTVHIYH